MNEFSRVFNKFAILKKIPIFSHLTWFELHTIAKKSELVDYGKGDMILKEGSAPDAFYCLISGRVQAYGTSVTGHKENLEFILQGTPFGIASLFTGDNHSLNFEALNDSVVLRIPKEDFTAILKSIPHLGIEFSHTLSRRIQQRAIHKRHDVENMIISIYSPVKGSGSSTYAMNLALSLEKETNSKVLLVNISSNLKPEEPLPSATSEASPQWKKTPVKLRTIVDDHQKILAQISYGDRNLDLLQVVFDADDQLIFKQISQFVSTLVHDYHYVIADLPNDMDDVVLQTLTQSDLVHLVSQNRREDLKLARLVIDDLGRRLKDRFSVEKVQVIISAMHPPQSISPQEINEVLNYNVATVLPIMNRDELTKTIIAHSMTVMVPDISSQYAKVVRRIARKIGGVMVGLVLGGGAALGIAHVGVIRVLEKEGIPVDVVVGSSMGALIASLWVVGNKADQLETIAREFENKVGMLKLFDPVFPRSGFIGGRLIKLWLRKHLGDKTFYDAQIPTKIVSYDLIRREEQILEEGSLVEAVRESIAIPGVIEPVFRDGKMIIDGGVLNPLPVNVLRDMGIHRIIAVNVLQSPTDVSKGYELEQKQMQDQALVPFFDDPMRYLGWRIKKKLYVNIPDIIIRTLQASEYVIADKSASAADVLIHPDLVGINWFELYEVDKLIKSGEEATRKQLAAIKKLVGV